MKYNGTPGDLQDDLDSISSRYILISVLEMGMNRDTGQLPEDVGKGSPSTFPDWHTTGEGGPQQCIDESEQASRL